MADTAVNERKRIREWLDDKRDLAKGDAADSHKVAPNSYGAGYDRGYLDMLEETLKFLNGEIDG